MNRKTEKINEISVQSYYRGWRLFHSGIFSDIFSVKRKLFADSYSINADISPINRVLIDSVHREVIKKRELIDLSPV